MHGTTWPIEQRVATRCAVGAGPRACPLFRVRPACLPRVWRFRGAIIACKAENLDSAPDNDSTNDAWLSHTAGEAEGHADNGPCGADGALLLLQIIDDGFRLTDVQRFFAARNKAYDMAAR